MKIGITERGDAALDHNWKPWVESGKPAILITKDPGKLLKEINKDMNIIVHCTITGLGRTKFEPNVPFPDESIESMHNIAEKIGSNRVVLRIDPIIPTPKGKEKAKHILSRNKGYRVRISFLDNYRHVKDRFRKVGLTPLYYDFHAPLKIRKEIWEDMGKPEVCGEPGFDCTGCVSSKDMEIFGIKFEVMAKSKQREFCECVTAKTELLSNRKRCFHGCLYCYWRQDK